MCVACALAAVSPRARSTDASMFPDVAKDWTAGEISTRKTMVTWTGVAGVVFECEGTRIAIDPFVTRPSLFATLFRRAKPSEDVVARELSGLDAVFVGHTHFDHAMDLPAVARSSPEARVHGSRTTVELLRRLGVEESRLDTVSDGVEIRHGPFRIVPVRTAHGRVPFVGRIDRIELPEKGVPRTPFRWPRGEVFAYRVETSDATVHVQGSAGLDEESLARQGPCDVLVACLAARRGTPRYLERLAERLRPKVLVPCHHDDFFRSLASPPRPVATLDWPRFLQEAATVERSFGTRVVLPVRGVQVGL